jgi:hypothetical protein
MSFFRRDTDEAEYKRTKNYYEKSWVKNIFFCRRREIREKIKYNYFLDRLKVNKNVIIYILKL